MRLFWQLEIKKGQRVLSLFILVILFLIKSTFRELLESLKLIYCSSPPEVLVQIWNECRVIEIENFKL
jgi:hypothetical protein